MSISPELLVFLFFSVRIITSSDIVDVLSEKEATNLWEPAIVIDSAFYSHYVVDSHFESSLQSLLSSGFIGLFQVNCPAAAGRGVLCSAMAESHIVFVSMENPPKALLVEPHSIPAVFASNLIRNAYPKLIKEFGSSEAMNKALLKQRPVFIAYIPPENTDDLVNYIITAKNSASLAHKFALVSEVGVVGEATHKVPGVLEPGQVVVWFSDRIGEFRGWKMKIFARGMEGFQDFLVKCSYPTHVHYRGKESHKVFKGSGLPQVFIILNNDKMSLITTLVHPLGVDLIGDFVIMTINIDTHPKMLEYFAGADTDNLPDVYFRPIPTEIIALSADIKRTPSTLSNALRSMVKDFANTGDGKGNDDDLNDQLSTENVIDMSLEDFNKYKIAKNIGIMVAFVPSASPLSERARTALEETLHSTQHIIQETVFIHVQATDGMSSITPPEGIHLVSLPVILFRRHDDGKWFQFESDISFQGVLNFLSRCLDLTPKIIDEINERHSTLWKEEVDADTPPDKEVVPVQMLEDDEYGKFVESEKIRVADYKDFELAPSEFGKAISSEAGAIIVYFQPWSVRSRAILPDMVRMKSLLGSEGVGVRTVNCQNYPDLCDPIGITAYPTVLFYRRQGEENEVYKGVHHPSEIVNSFLKVDTEAIQELTPYSLPTFIAKGKPLMILAVLNNESDLLQNVKELKEGNPQLTVGWLDHSKYKQLLGNVTMLKESKLPSLIAMDTTKTNVRMFTCDILSLKDAENCLKKKWTELPWQQAPLSERKWLPKVEPFRFPSNSARTSDDQSKVDPVPNDSVMNKKVAAEPEGKPHPHYHEEL